MLAKKNYHSYDSPRFFFYLGLLTIGQTVFRPALNFTLSDWFFLFSLLLAISESLLRRNTEIRFPPYMIVGLFFFTFGGILSSGYAKMPSASAIALIKYFYLIAVWFWLCTTVLQKPEHIRTAIILWTTSAAISGFGALIQLIWEDIIPGTSPIWGRMTGFTEHVNDLGGLTSVALIPAIMLTTSFPEFRWRRVYSWLCAILISAGLVLSVSLSGVTALLVSMLVWTVKSKLTFQNLIILCTSTILLTMVIFVQNQSESISVLSRLNEISKDGLSISTLQSRMYTYKAAWDSIISNPFWELA
jgi:low affinity Fe/Cu permease